MRCFDATIVIKCCDAQVSPYLALPVLSLKRQCCSQSAEMAQGELRCLHWQCKVWENFLGTVILNFSTQLYVENKATATRRQRAKYTFKNSFTAVINIFYFCWLTKKGGRMLHFLEPSRRYFCAFMQLLTFTQEVRRTFIKMQQGCSPGTL